MSNETACKTWPYISLLQNPCEQGIEQPLRGAGRLAHETLPGASQQLKPSQRFRVPDAECVRPDGAQAVRYAI